MTLTINTNNLNINNLNNLTIQQLFNLFLQQYPKQITNHLNTTLPTTEIFGLGSVLLFELGLTPQFTFNTNTITLTL